MMHWFLIDSLVLAEGFSVCNSSSSSSGSSGGGGGGSIKRTTSSTQVCVRTGVLS